MAIEAALDLSAIVLLVVALGLALLALKLAKAFTSVFAVLPGIGGAVEQALDFALVDPLEAVVSGLESAISQGLSLLLDALVMLLAIPLLIGYGVYEGMKALWHDAIRKLVNALVKPVEKIAHQALTLAKTAEKDAAAAEARAVHAVKAEVTGAIKTAERYADHAVSTALHAAERYADTAVAKVAAAESAAIATATSLAHTAEHDAAQALSQAEAYAGTLVAPVAGEVTALEDYIKGLNLGTLAAGTAALAALLTGVLAETGLSNAECRSKVKGICATDPAAWGRLLALAGFLALAFDFQEFVDAAELVAKGVGGAVAEIEGSFPAHLPPLELAA